MAAQNHVQITILKEHDNQNQNQVPEEDFDYSQRAQWLRAAVLGANDGLVSTASLMITTRNPWMGVGAVQKNVNTMILTGFAGLFVGACSMAIGEFVSVYSQLDIELAQMKRDKTTGGQNQEHQQQEEGNKEQLPNPFQAAVASAIAFSLGAVVPILAAAFIANHKVRLAVIVVAVSFALLAFGGIGAFLGRSPMAKSCARVLIGGWMAMAITFGLTKLIGSTGMKM
ncbi:vacuolar iron transporter -like 4 [Nicotiana attenuata]|uniref:Vacuolar iron transporter n=2 Tax=Nicotiana attenuata TaxID=49451 RepID=A0A314L931_NICAT|nr:vacuolar iron transporter -like 4 [Nicotiana attenuata]